MTTPLRIGILGCARIAEQGIVEPGRVLAELEVAAVAARDPHRAAAYAHRHGIPRTHATYDDLLADPDLDAVYNPLPNSLHGPWTIRALEAGKAVLCEKPLASNAVEAQLMADAAARSGCTLVEAFHYRYHPLARRAVELVDGGAVGRPHRMEARFDLPSGLVSPDNIRLRHDLAGGATMDLGSYCANILRLLTGTEPRVVSAQARLVGPDIDEAMEAELLFPPRQGEQAVESRIHASFAEASFDASVVVSGDEGTLVVRNPFAPQRGHSLELRRGGDVTTEEVELTPTFTFQAREFVEAVRTGGPVRTSAVDGVANMAVVDAVYLAAGLRPRGA